MCNASKSGIGGNPRRNYCSNVETRAIKSDSAVGAASSCANPFNIVKIKELAQFYGVLVHDGVLGSSNGALHRRQIKGRNFDKDTCETMNNPRQLQIKRALNLNDNDAYIPRGEEGHDPTKKFDLVLKHIVQNCNATKNYASTDLTLDEITWAHGGHGPTADGLM